MNDDLVMRILFSFLSGVLFFYLVLKPLILKIIYSNKLNKRIKVLKKLGMLDMETVIRDPNLTAEELELLNSEELPTDEHILKYYKMYCKKWEIDHRDQWTTLKPILFEDWEKKANTPTKRHMFDKDDLSSIAGFQVSGGYQYIIPQTCDVMIGIPPMQVYHRFADYASLVETEDANFIEELENAETE